jgi:hypothetical protein
MTFVFTVSFFLTSFGFGEAKVIAHNKVEALTLAAATEQGWMLSDPDVSIYNMERGVLAMCHHDSGSGRPDGSWECVDCPSTWLDSDIQGPMPSATTMGFRAYCENLRIR